MIKELLRIRLKQLFRIVIGIGIFRTILLFGVFSFALLAMFVKLEEKSYQEIIVGIVVLIIFSIHINRKDKVFIKIYAINSKKVFLTEYILFSIPLIVSLIYYNLWIYTFFYLLFLIVILFVKTGTRKSNLNSIFQKIIPNDNFEWKSGLRKNLFWFVGIWLIGLLSSFFIASIPIVIFILGAMVLNFYEKHEPLEILIANELNSKKFLIKKLKNHLFAFFIVIFPLILSFVIFNPEYYYIPLIEFIIFSILIVYTILLKYAFYRPNNRLSAPGVFIMLGMVSLFIPVLAPIVLLLSIKFLFQAIDNLNIYLNDFN